MTILEQKTITLHDIELDSGQGIKSGHLVADFMLLSDLTVSMESNIEFQTFGNNGEESEEIIRESELKRWNPEMLKQFYSKAEKAFRV